MAVHPTIIIIKFINLRKATSCHYNTTITPLLNACCVIIHMSIKYKTNSAILLLMKTTKAVDGHTFFLHICLLIFTSTSTLQTWQFLVVFHKSTKPTYFCIALSPEKFSVVLSFAEAYTNEQIFFHFYSQMPLFAHVHYSFFSFHSMIQVKLDFSHNKQIFPIYLFLCTLSLIFYFYQCWHCSICFKFWYRGWQSVVENHPFNDQCCFDYRRNGNYKEMMRQKGTQYRKKTIGLSLKDFERHCIKKNHFLS